MKLLFWGVTRLFSTTVAPSTALLCSAELSRGPLGGCAALRLLSASCTRMWAVLFQGAGVGAGEPPAWGPRQRALTWRPWVRVHGRGVLKKFILTIFSACPLLSLEREFWSSLARRFWRCLPTVCSEMCSCLFCDVSFLSRCIRLMWSQLEALVTLVPAEGSPGAFLQKLGCRSRDPVVCAGEKQSRIEEGCSWENWPLPGESVVLRSAFSEGALLAGSGVRLAPVGPGFPWGPGGGRHPSSPVGRQVSGEVMTSGPRGRVFRCEWQRAAVSILDAWPPSVRLPGAWSTLKGWPESTRAAQGSTP